MKTIASWIITLFLFAIGAWPMGMIGIGVSLYITIKELLGKENAKENGELRHQREAEQREIDMVRKSNEILLHLIQDEHREKEDR